MCNCYKQDIYEGNNATDFENRFLEEVKVNAFDWKTLYICKDCSTYWEETYLDGRFGGVPQLKKINRNYAISEWNLNL